MGKGNILETKVFILVLLIIIAIETIVIGRNLNIQLIEFFGILIQIGIFYIAFLALQQVSLIREQNIITRQSVAVNELKSFQKWVEKFEEFNKKVEDLNKPQIVYEMKDFNFSEGLSNTFKDNILSDHNFFTKNKELSSFGIKCANELEAISVSFTRGVADISVVEGSLCEVFCAFVEKYAYFYCANRSELNKKYIYNNTIQLYKQLKILIGTKEEQLKRFNDEKSHLIM